MFLLRFAILFAIFTHVVYINQLISLSDDWLKIPKFKVRSHVIICILGICFVFFHWSLALLLIVLYGLFHQLYIKYKKKKEQSLIEYYGYKIFKFLINQVSSGILISDAIKSMYRIVDEKNLKKTLIEVSAYYSKTTDLSASLEILKNKYKGIEVDTLCMAIEHGIYTGANYETLRKMEQLLFKRYINQIKLETRWRKKRSILSVLLLCSIMILMIAIPVVMDMLEAFNQIFLY